MIEMKVLKNRKEWLGKRSKYIGGSDCACILGLNPYKSNVDLYLEKIGEKQPQDISDKPQVKFGIAAEPIIRELFQINYPQMQMNYVENNNFINDKYPFARASLDGWLTDQDGINGIWECKTSQIVSSAVKEKWNDQVPDNYYCQILHYFLVREDCDFAILTALLTWDYSEKEPYQQLRNYRFERSDVKEEAKEEAKQWVSFKCLLTLSQARALGRFFKENNITFMED